MKKFAVILAALSMAACACSQKSGDIPDVWPWNDPDADDKPFTEVTDGSFGTLPDYIKLYKSPDVLQGKNAVAWIATADLSKASLHVWGINDPELDGSPDPLKTPTQVFNTNDGPVLVLNGGYFYTDEGVNYPASLAIENGTLLSPNINYAFNKDYSNTYYPTRAAFLVHGDGSMEVGWSYMTTYGDHFFYSAPAQNDTDTSPLGIPSATFPVEAETLEAVTAIGAGPVLIKDGEFQNTWRFECIPGDYDVNCLGQAPRSAIGFTADGLLVLFACEGRDMTEGVPGYSTEQVARIMQEFGCTDAINLDGGGSSCLLVNGVETIKPSDGVQRPVGSCIYIK